MMIVLIDGKWYKQVDLHTPPAQIKRPPLIAPALPRRAPPSKRLFDQG